MKRHAGIKVLDPLVGVWRLVGGRAWDELGNLLPPPYGEHPLGQLGFANGRMLAALCNGDDAAAVTGIRAYSSYGGVYQFNGTTLTVTVDIASDATRIGSLQTRQVSIEGERMLMRPPTRRYGEMVQRREIIWERVWHPGRSAD